MNDNAIHENHQIVILALETSKKENRRVQNARRISGFTFISRLPSVRRRSISVEKISGKNLGDQARM